MELSQILRADSVRVSANATSKKQLLQLMADMVGDMKQLPSVTVLTALQSREALGPTGMGAGVALPHARIAGLQDLFGVLVTLDKPVDFDAVDSRPVDIAFGLFAPDAAGVEHLRALSRVARTLRDKSVCDRLRAAQDASVAYAILTDLEASRAA